MTLFWTLFILYWLPTVIAVLRGSPNAMAIAALNFLLGWTVLGWIVALVWSLAAINRHPGVTVQVANNHTINSPAAPASSEPMLLRDAVASRRHLGESTDALSARPEQPGNERGQVNQGGSGSIGGPAASS